MAYDHLSEESKVQLIAHQWQDHFQTRAQTWKALEIAAILSVALIGIDWRIESVVAKFVAAILLGIISFLGGQITIRHRNEVEINKFTIMKELGQSLDIQDSKFGIPEAIGWRSIFKLSHNSTSLFILRMHFVIFMLAVCYLVFAVMELSKAVVSENSNDLSRDHLLVVSENSNAL